MMQLSVQEINLIDVLKSSRASFGHNRYQIKKQDINYRLQIIETLWKIIFSDKSEDMYESNLMRRICGLLYVSDADNGKIKEKIKLLNK